MPPCFDTAGCTSVYLSTPACYSVFPAEMMFLAGFFSPLSAKVIFPECFNSENFSPG